MRGGGMKVLTRRTGGGDVKGKDKKRTLGGSAQQRKCRSMNSMRFALNEMQRQIKFACRAFPWTDSPVDLAASRFAFYFRSILQKLADSRMGGKEKWGEWATISAEDLRTFLFVAPVPPHTPLAR